MLKVVFCKITWLFSRSAVVGPCMVSFHRAPNPWCRPWVWGSHSSKLHMRSPCCCCCCCCCCWPLDRWLLGHTVRSEQETGKGVVVNRNNATTQDPLSLRISSRLRFPCRKVNSGCRRVCESAVNCPDETNEAHLLHLETTSGWRLYHLYWQNTKTGGADVKKMWNEWENNKKTTFLSSRWSSLVKYAMQL